MRNLLAIAALLLLCSCGSAGVALEQQRQQAAFEKCNAEYRAWWHFARPELWYCEADGYCFEGKAGVMTAASIETCAAIPREVPWLSR